MKELLTSVSKQTAMKKLVVGAALAVAGLVLMAGPVGAQEADSIEAGWWTSSPLPPPDAPADGLVVQGSLQSESPTAYAAVSATLSSGSTALSLTLQVAEGSASTPGSTLALCPLTDAFTPAQGGAADGGPAYDCATSQVTATASEDGTSYTWDISGMPTTDAVAVAVVPTTPTDRVVFSKPTTASVTVEVAPATPEPADQSGTPEPAADSFTTSNDFSVPADSGPLTFEVPAPATPVVPDLPRTAPEISPPAATRPVAAQPIGGDGDDGRPLAPFIVAGLVALAAVLWGSAGRGEPEAA